MSNIHVHSERSARTGICIVWPAWFPGSTDPELHATALFLGTTDTVDYTMRDLSEAIPDRYLWPAWTNVTGTDQFGTHKDIPVLLLEHTNLLTITRNDILERLERRGINASTTFEFTPHVTIAKEAEHVQDSMAFAPSHIHLESPVLWWGEERVLHTNHDTRKLQAVV